MSLLVVINMKEVSIIVPVYNVEKYISNCIDSLINQTYKNIEVILVDDGSCDNSYSICEEYSKKYSYIKVYHKKNGGPSSARNYGIEKANGEYICFVDSDDYVSEKYIENLLIDDFDLSFGGFVDVCGDRKIEKQICNQIEKYYDKDIYVKLLENTEIDLFNSPWCKLFKKSIIEKNNIKYDESLHMGEDLIFNINYLKYCKSLIMIPECLYFYKRDIDSSLTKKFEITRWNTEKKVYHEYKDLYKYYGLYEKYKSKIDCMLLMGAKKTIYILCSSNLKHKAAIEYIKKICNDNEIRQIIKDVHPKNKLTKILTILIKNKMATLIYLLFKVRTKI